MSKRLQVILDDVEYRELQRSAKRARMTVSAWVRQSLRELRRREPIVDVEKKMLEEIERGYLGGRTP